MQVEFLMAPKFKQTDREQIFLLPPDIRDWIPKDDIVHFVIEAAQMVPLEDFVFNETGTGKAQYHPKMMLALLLYCYSHGIFSSRRIERATYKDICVRYLCGNTHPDHDTICFFRNRNEVAIKSAFLKILLLAKELGVLKIGSVSTDGTKIKANASINKSIRYDRAKELEKQLDLEINALVNKSKEADSQDNDDDDNLKGDLTRLTKLREKMKKAQEELEKQAKKRAQEEMESYQDKVLRRNQRKGRAKGRIITRPKGSPEDSQMVNMSDPDSRIMKKNKRSEYTQSFNGQAVVDADGTMLALVARVTNHSTDARELTANIQAIPEELGKPNTVLADKGYASEIPVKSLQEEGIDVLVSVTNEASHNRRKHDFRPVNKDDKIEKKEMPFQKQWVKDMSEKMAKPESREEYKKRKQSVEPVFGIVKHIMGFRQFLLRGLDKVRLEWTLVLAAYNLKRLRNILQR
jgi:transposase